MPVKKKVKVDLAGMYIVSITGMNLADKKKKTIREKMSARLKTMMAEQSNNNKK